MQPQNSIANKPPPGAGLVPKKRSYSGALQMLGIASTAAKHGEMKSTLSGPIPSSGFPTSSLLRFGASSAFRPAPVATSLAGGLAPAASRSRAGSWASGSARDDSTETASMAVNVATAAGLSSLKLQHVKLAYDSAVYSSAKKSRDDEIESLTSSLAGLGLSSLQGPAAAPSSYLAAVRLPAVASVGASSSSPFVFCPSATVPSTSASATPASAIFSAGYLGPGLSRPSLSQLTPASSSSSMAVAVVTAPVVPPATGLASAALALKPQRTATLIEQKALAAIAAAAPSTAPAASAAPRPAGAGAGPSGVQVTAVRVRPPRAAVRPFPIDLTDDEADVALEAVTGKGNDSDILLRSHNVDFARKDIRVLRDGWWLKDEAINMYVALLWDWNKESNGAMPTIYLPNSFFLTTLWDPDVRGKDKAYDYSRVARWTKRAKITVFNPDGSPGIDAIIIPRNIGNTHWAVIYIDMINKIIWHLDSLNGPGTLACKAMLRWLQDEAKDKQNTDLDVSQWQIRGPPAGLPQQKNGCDCGAFLLAFAYFLVQGKIPTEADFSQKHMGDFRLHVAAAILRESIVRPQ